MFVFYLLTNSLALSIIFKSCVAFTRASPKVLAVNFFKAIPAPKSSILLHRKLIPKNGLIMVGIPAPHSSTSGP